MLLKRIRLQNNLTIRELSQKSGVPVRTIEDIEKRGSCKTDTAEKLANALNISLQDLICGMEYSGRYANVDLRDILKFLLQKLSKEDIETMIYEINTFSNQIHMKAMNEAYFLYEKYMDSQDSLAIHWKSVGNK